MRHAAGDGLLQVGVVENDVRRLAAQFLTDTLDGIGRTLGDVDACAGRAGEGNHVDAGMLAHRCADIGTEAVDQIEHTLRHAGLMKNFRENQRGRRRIFRRLQDHGAARRDRRRDLAGDLVERPVPRRDHTDDAHRLAHEHGGAHRLFELILLQGIEGGHQMAKARAGLHLFRHRQRRAHLVGNRSADVLHPGLVGRDDLFQKRHAFFAAGHRERFKRTAGRGDGLVHIGFRSNRDLVHPFFRRRIDDRNGLLDGRVDPGAVDIELHTIGHGVSLTAVVMRR